MFNNVSFGAISTDPTIKLQDATIVQPQSNSAAPAASTGVSGDSFEKKGSGSAKKVIGFVAVIGAALAALGFAVKKGKLAKIELGDEAKFIDKAKNALADVGEKVNEFAAKGKTKASDLYQTVKSKFSKAQDVVEESAEKIADEVPVASQKTADVAEGVAQAVSEQPVAVIADAQKLNPGEIGESVIKEMEQANKHGALDLTVSPDKVSLASKELSPEEAQKIAEKALADMEQANKHGSLSNLAAPPDNIHLPKE